MRPVALRHDTALGLALPLALVLALTGVVAAETGLVRFPHQAAASFAPQTVMVAPRPYSYRAGGEFQRGRAAVDGPLVTVTSPEPLEIMTFQVSALDYGHCVIEAACDAAEPRRHGSGDVPVTGVSYDDAMAYAAWLSARTGDTWRLPTIGEWAFAAGSKAVDHALGIETDATNPAGRWLAAYEKEASLQSTGLAVPEPLGASGVNEFGVADLAGAVWEWTATCVSRTTLADEDSVVSHIEACGVHYLEGRHRTPMSVFVRDAQGGGCSVGAPPDNLGFRLVRQRGWIEQLTDGIGGFLRSPVSGHKV